MRRVGRHGEEGRGVMLTGTRARARLVRAFEARGRGYVMRAVVAVLRQNGW